MTATPLSLAVLLSTAGLAVPAVSSGATGGAAVPDRPVVLQLQCGDGQLGRCARGLTVNLQGAHLRGARRVVFVGRLGRRERAVVRVHPTSDDVLAVRVPAGAHTGPVVAAGPAGSSLQEPRLVVLPREPASPGGTDVGVLPGPEPGAVPVPGPGVFPIQGPHGYGTAVNRFGGGRHHQGQDVLADCGLPVVAALAGTVRRVDRQSAAGNYVVIDTPDGASNAYMHLRAPATVRAGDEVHAGDRIGEVGRTGDATVCHLHFEQWTAPGWYQGGRAVDPIAELDGWDAAGAPQQPPSAPAAHERTSTPDQNAT